MSSRLFVFILPFVVIAIFWAMSKYESIEETISPRALETIGDWILKH